MAPPDASQALTFRIVEALFNFKPLFKVAVRKARSKIAQRALDIGYDMDAQVAELQSIDWDARLREVQDPDLKLPDYYTQPFHAYPDGNLSWEAALQVEVAAKSVHAPVMDPEGKRLDPDGDAQLRASYSSNMQQLLPNDLGAIREILDIGCATGLSSLELLRVFPDAHVTGVDLSPHFLAVGQHLREQAQGRQADSPGGLRLMHAAGEATGLPSQSVDMVSCCLVMHELPQHATCAIVEEAYRVLRPGGIMSIMEMDPVSPKFQRMFANPFAFAAFKSTEPWLLEYVSLDLPHALQAAGFTCLGSGSNSPGHKTVVAQKPDA